MVLGFRFWIFQRIGEMTKIKVKMKDINIRKFNRKVIKWQK
jgi:hypothetical protein